MVCFTAVNLSVFDKMARSIKKSNIIGLNMGFSCQNISIFNTLYIVNSNSKCKKKISH